MSAHHAHSELLQWLVPDPSRLEEIFDSLPDVLVYLKDAQARYRWVNASLVGRAGIKDRAGVTGKTADQLFPASGASTTAQDLAVIRGQQPIRDQLRLYRSSNGDRHWCLSSKFPIFGGDGQALGLIGVSRDLPRPDDRHRDYRRLSVFIAFLDRNLDKSLRISEAAKRASLSMDSLERLTRTVFHLTPKQLLIKKRIDRACQRLEGSTRSVIEIADECGYADHSAFTRQFKVATGMTPSGYRLAHRSQFT